ncbi:MAG: acyl-[acyl-carrier-protein] thioesterase [Candidatus Symbiothrix sp.]|jgi:acyl-ACP thioesterase|nr:acyl-[acyl-carrier-protein] thioesterase [Candidatus Symbiothrix sp.]
MEEKVSSYKFPIRTFACDFSERATLPVMGNFVLEAASLHSNEGNFGHKQISKDNVTWVLSRLSIEMYEYSFCGENLTVQTWIEKVDQFFTQRCCRFTDSNGKVTGFARSIWVAMDIKTRRPLDIRKWRPDLANHVTDEIACPIEKYAIIFPVNKVEPVMNYKIRYMDIDINHHMNSIKYIEHTINIFDLSFFREKIIHRLDIVYLAEGLVKDKLELYMQDVSEEEYLIDFKKEGKSICRCRVVWTPIPPGNEVVQ